MKIETRLREALLDQAHRVEVSGRPPIQASGRVPALRGLLSTSRLAVGSAAVVLALLIAMGLSQWDVLRPGTVVFDTPTYSGQAVVSALDLPTPVDLQLLALLTEQARNLAFIDLTAGEVTVFPPGSFGMSPDPIDGGLLTGEGLAVVWQDGTVTAFHPGTSEPLLTHRPDKVLSRPGYAPAVEVVPTADGHALWVVQVGTAIGSDVVEGLAELVDVGSGEVLTAATLPPNSRPVTATDRGLLLSSHDFVEAPAGWIEEEGSRVVWELGLDGSMTERGGGVPVAASGTTLAVLHCAQHRELGDCGLEHLDLETGTRTAVASPLIGSWSPATRPVEATSVRGQMIMVLHDGDDAYLMVVDPEGPHGAQVLHRFEGPPQPALWDRTGERVILIENPGADGAGSLTVVNVQDRTSLKLEDVIPDGYHVVGTS